MGTLISIGGRGPGPISSFNTPAFLGLIIKFISLYKMFFIFIILLLISIQLQCELPAFHYKWFLWLEVECSHCLTVSLPVRDINILWLWLDYACLLFTNGLLLCILIQSGCLIACTASFCINQNSSYIWKITQSTYMLYTKQGFYFWIS